MLTILMLLIPGIFAAFTLQNKSKDVAKKYIAVVIYI